MTADPSDMKAFNEQVIEEFRTSQGKVGGMFEGVPILILTTTGAKTGRTLLSPLAATPEDDRWLVYASAGGADNHPAWYHNLVANPDVTVEYGTETFPARATVITGEEYDRLYARQAKRYPNFADYQAKTSRMIPVIELRRAAN